MYHSSLDSNKKHILMMTIYCMLLMTLTFILGGCGSAQEKFSVIEEKVDEVYQGTDQEEEMEAEESSVTTQTDSPVTISGDGGIEELIKFSELAEYNGTIYQNVQLGDYVQPDWVKVPVDSSSFTVANNKIYYLTGTGWDYYFGDPITYSLHCCNLDGSDDRCLLEVPDCQMGYAGISGNRLVGLYYLEEQCQYFMIDLTTDKVEEIAMDLDEGGYGEILGLDDEHLYYISDGAIMRSDFQGTQGEVLYTFPEDLDTLGNLTNITVYHGSIYAFALTDLGTTGTQDAYRYHLVQFIPDVTEEPTILSCEVTGINAVAFQIIDDCVYYLKSDKFYQYSLEMGTEYCLTTFGEDVYGAFIKCMDNQGVYCIIDTPIDETTQDDRYCVRIKEDNTYEVIDGWYIP